MENAVFNELLGTAKVTFVEGIPYITRFILERLAMSSLIYRPLSTNLFSQILERQRGFLGLVYTIAFSSALNPRRDRILPRPCKRASRFPRRPFTRRVFLVEKLACQLFDEYLVTRKKSANCGHLHNEFSSARKKRRGKCDRVNAALVPPQSATGSIR